MTFYDYMKDDELMELLNNERLSRLVEDMGILGIAIPSHSRKILYLIMQEEKQLNT